MSRELPTLPQSLINLIGEYGFARTDGASEIERIHRWELLIDGIKLYAGSYAEEAVRLEREACVAICESTKHLGYVPAEDGAAREYYDAGAADCADAIRARSQEGQG
jgi:hypothetical protein